MLRTRETNFFEAIIDMCRPQTSEEWHQLFDTGKEEYYEYYYSFITSGCFAFLRRWFSEGMHESPERMAILAEKMMVNSVRDLS